MAIERFLFATDEGLCLWNKGTISRYVLDDDDLDKKIGREIQKIIIDFRNKKMPNTKILKRAIENVTKEKFMTYSSKMPNYNVMDTNYYWRFYEILYQPELFDEEVRRMQDEKKARAADTHQLYLRDYARTHKYKKKRKIHERHR